MDLLLFKKAIKERCGLCFDEQREDILSEGIKNRMSDRDERNEAAYLERILRDGEEFTRLVSLLTVNETFLFREPVHLELLSNKIVPGMLLNRPAGKAIKVLCAGCSTGEEPYSIAMALHEKYGLHSKNFVSITGFDIDREVLKKAEEGVFGGYSFRALNDGLRDKYFEPSGKGKYRIRERLRDWIKFTEVNLKGDIYPDELNGADVIFYRNVSIYFDPKTQKDIFAKLSGLLNEGGYMVLSSTETYSHNSNVLSLIEMDGVFLFCKTRPSASTVAQKAKVQHAVARDFSFKSVSGGVKATSVTSAKHNQSTPAASAESGYKGAFLMAKEKRYAEALESIDSVLINDPEFMKAYALKASIMFNLQRNDEAERLCIELIDKNRWSLEGHLLLGLLAKIRKDDDAAVKRFKEAVYVLPSCWLAHFFLGEIYLGRGDLDAALREYEVVAGILGKAPTHEEWLGFFPISFSPEQIKLLCEKKISEMGRPLEGRGGRRRHGV